MVFWNQNSPVEAVIICAWLQQADEVPGPHHLAHCDKKAVFKWCLWLSGQYLLLSMRGSGRVVGLTSLYESSGALSL